MESEESDAVINSFVDNALDEPLIGDEENNNNNSRSSKFFLTIEPIVFFVFLAETLSEAVIANFVLLRSCEVHFHFNESLCSLLGSKNENASDIEALNHMVQPYATVILTGMSFLVTLFPAFMSLFLGPWSDYNGRKLLLVIPPLGYVMKYVLFAVLSSIPNLDSTFALIVVLPAACLGGFINFLSAAYSYICDISSEENRSFRISLLEAVMFCGSIAGTTSASFVYNAGGKYGFLLVFGLSAGIILLSVIGTFIFLPESVERTESGKGIWHMFELKLFKEMISICFKKRENNKRAVIFLVMTSLIVTIVSMMGESNVQFFFTKLRFNWNIEDYTIWASITLAINLCGLLVGSVILAKWLKISDAMLGVISYVMKTAAAFYIAFIPSYAPYLMYYVGLVKLFDGLCGPAGRACLSKAVPNEDLGKVFALTGSCESLFPLALAPLYTLLYNSTIKTFPSAFYLLSGGLFIINSIFFIIVYFMQRPAVESQ